MKKILLLLVMFSFGASSFAQTAVWNETMKGVNLLNEKIQKNQAVEASDFPGNFVWDWTLPEEYKCQPCVNVYVAAEKKHRENPEDYIAAYNYAMILAYPRNQYGFLVSERKPLFDEAYKRFEMAKKLNKNFLPVYVEQELLIDRYLFSDIYYAPNFYSLGYRLEGYEKQAELARGRFSLIEKQIDMGYPKANYLEAAILARFLRIHDGFQFYADKEALYMEQVGKDAVKEEIRQALDYHYNELSWQTESKMHWNELASHFAYIKHICNLFDKYFQDYVQDMKEYKALTDLINKGPTIQKKLYNDSIKNPDRYMYP